VFSADELIALCRGFDLPIGFFLVPPPPAMDIGLQVPDGGVKGLDPIVMLDAMLGAPENLGYLESELLDYSASIAPKPKSKREQPSVSPADLADRLSQLMAQRAKSGLRSRFGGIEKAKDVLERLVELLADLDEAAPDIMTEEMKRSGPGAKRSEGLEVGVPFRQRSRSAASPSASYPGKHDHPGAAAVARTGDL
jgi:hypothetical protein